METIPLKSLWTNCAIKDKNNSYDAESMHIGTSIRLLNKIVFEKTLQNHLVKQAVARDIDIWDRDDVYTGWLYQ